MFEMDTSSLMSGEGKRVGSFWFRDRALPRLYGRLGNYHGIEGSFCGIEGYCCDQTKLTCSSWVVQTLRRPPLGAAAEARVRAPDRRKFLPTDEVKVPGLPSKIAPQLQ